jgi:hypothetical protein
VCWLLCLFCHVVVLLSILSIVVIVFNFFIVFLMILLGQNVISVQRKNDFSQMMIWVCVSFHKHVFPYVINLYTKNFNHPNPIFFIMTYVTNVKNIPKIESKSDVDPHLHLGPMRPHDLGSFIL